MVSLGNNKKLWKFMIAIIAIILTEWKTTKKSQYTHERLENDFYEKKKQYLSRRRVYDFMVH